MAVDPSKIVIDYSRDSLLNEFTRQTMKERYMLPGENSPQDSFARASAAFADDEAHAQRLYDYVSRNLFMFATPLLSNGGSERGLPISCFLNVAEDSREGIFDHWAETGWLSSVGGGVGAYWGELRGAGEKTSRGSSSTGVIPFIATVDRIILSVSQGGTRRGSYAAYLDISHPEIEEFVTMRKPTGGDQNRKATNIHNAVNISDEFMIAVRDDADFHLRSPKDQSILKTLKARDLWHLLIETRMQTGEPYMVFIDTINKALPQSQKDLGLKVHQSNLCVAPTTTLLIENEGNIEIGGLEGKKVKAWNGREWSEVTVRKTAEQADLVRVWFEDGGYIDCTPQHQFYTTAGKFSAVELEEGMVLEQGTGALPIIGEGRSFKLSDDIVGASTQSFSAGWATFAGFEEENRLTIYVPNSLNAASKRMLLSDTEDSHGDEDGVFVRFEPKSIHAGVVPFSWSLNERRHWLMGALEAAGDWLEDDSYICVGSTDTDLIRQMRLLALEIGLSPVVRYTDTMNAFMMTPDDYDALYQYEHAVIKAKNIVVDVQPLPFRMDTYCATEPKEGRLTFNGYITGNCTEITLPTGRDQDGKMRTAVCCLSSVNAEKFDEWSLEPLFIPDLMRMLDNALTVFIETAPNQLENAKYSAMRERSVGLGVLGFQAYLQKHAVAMESERATEINIQIFDHLQRESNRASLKLGIERGEAPDMVGTGHRFAHRLAVAPNASSSILCGGTSPSIEPHRANAYLHKTLSGSFPVKNQYLEAELDKIGLNNDLIWGSIIANEGSVQQLTLPSHVKEVYRTAPEINQMALVKLAADRAPYICQAQSLNLFFEHNAKARDIYEAHFRAWEWGVKSLYYLRSTTPKRAENTNEKIERIVIAEGVEPKEDDECLACQG